MEALHRIGDLVWQDPGRVSGAVCFYGHRVPIQTLFDYLEGGSTVEAFCADYGIAHEQAIGVIRLGWAQIEQSIKAA